MNTIEMTLTSFNVFYRSVRVLCRTGRSILTRWHPLFAAPSLIQLLTKLVQDTTQVSPANRHPHPTLCGTINFASAVNPRL